VPDGKVTDYLTTMRLDYPCRREPMCLRLTEQQATGLPMAVANRDSAKRRNPLQPLVEVLLPTSR